MSEQFHPEVGGPAALKIDSETYSDLMNVSSKSAVMAFPFPVETNSNSNNPNEDPDNVKIVVQIVRISDEYLDALKRTGFDISRILTPERLETYELNNKKV